MLTFPQRGRGHLAMVHDGQALRLHQDGKVVKSLPVSGLLQNDRTPITIGEAGDPDLATDAFGGRITRVRITKRALGAQESALLMRRNR